MTANFKSKVTFIPFFSPILHLCSAWCGAFQMTGEIASKIENPMYRCTTNITHESHLAIQLAWVISYQRMQLHPHYLRTV